MSRTLDRLYEYAMQQRAAAARQQRMNAIEDEIARDEYDLYGPEFIMPPGSEPEPAVVPEDVGFFDALGSSLGSTQVTMELARARHQLENDGFIDVEEGASPYAMTGFGPEPRAPKRYSGPAAQAYLASLAKAAPQIGAAGQAYRNDSGFLAKGALDAASNPENYLTLATAPLGAAAGAVLAPVTGGVVNPVTGGMAGAAAGAAPMLRKAYYMSYEEGRQAGLTHEQAVVRAATQAGNEYIWELIPGISKFRNLAKGAGFLKKAGLNIAQEVGQENITTAAGNALDFVGTAGEGAVGRAYEKIAPKSWGEALQDQVDTTGAALFGAGPGAVIGAKIDQKAEQADAVRRLADLARLNPETAPIADGIELASSVFSRLRNESNQDVGESLLDQTLDKDTAYKQTADSFRPSDFPGARQLAGKTTVSAADIALSGLPKPKQVERTAAEVLSPEQGSLFDPVQGSLFGEPTDAAQAEASRARGAAALQPEEVALQGDGAGNLTGTVFNQPQTSDAEARTLATRERLKQEEIDRGAQQAVDFSRATVQMGPLREQAKQIAKTKEVTPEIEAVTKDYLRAKYPLAFSGQSNAPAREQQAAAAQEYSAVLKADVDAITNVLKFDAVRKSRADVGSAKALLQERAAGQEQALEKQTRDNVNRKNQPVPEQGEIDFRSPDGPLFDTAPQTPPQIPPAPTAPRGVNLTNGVTFTAQMGGKTRPLNPKSKPYPFQPTVTETPSVDVTPNNTGFNTPGLPTGTKVNFTQGKTVAAAKTAAKGGVKTVKPAAEQKAELDAIAKLAKQSKGSLQFDNESSPAVSTEKFKQQAKVAKEKTGLVKQAISTSFNTGEKLVNLVKNVYKDTLTDVDNRLIEKLSNNTTLRNTKVMVVSPEEMLRLSNEGSKRRFQISPYGLYRPSENTVYLRDSQGDGTTFSEGGLSPEVMLHELAHAATVAQLNAFGKGVLSPQARDAIKELRTIQEELRKFMEADTTLSPLERELVMEGTINEKELISYTYTNEQFRNIVKAKTPTLWERLKDVIAKFLGLKPAEKDMVERILNLSDTIIKAQERAAQRDSDFQKKYGGDDGRISAARDLGNGVVDATDDFAKRSEQAKDERLSKSVKETVDKINRISREGVANSVKIYREKVAPQIQTLKTLSDKVKALVNAELIPEKPRGLKKQVFGPNKAVHWATNFARRAGYVDAGIALEGREENLNLEMETLVEELSYGKYEELKDDLENFLAFAQSYADEATVTSPSDKESKIQLLEDAGLTEEQAKVALSNAQEKARAINEILNKSVVPFTPKNDPDLEPSPMVARKSVDAEQLRKDTVFSQREQEADTADTNLTGLKRNVMMLFSSSGKNTKMAQARIDWAEQQGEAQLVQIDASRNRLSELLRKSGYELKPGDFKNARIIELSKDPKTVAVARELAYIKNIVNQLSLLNVSMYREANGKNMSDEELNVLNKAVNNLDDYLTRTYKVDIGRKVGPLRGLAQKLRSNYPDAFKVFDTVGGQWSGIVVSEYMDWKKAHAEWQKKIKTDPKAPKPKPSDAAQIFIDARETVAASMLEYPKDWKTKASMSKLEDMYHMWYGQTWRASGQGETRTDRTANKREMLVKELEVFEETLGDKVMEMAEAHTMGILDRDINGKPMLGKGYWREYYRGGQQIDKTILTPRKQVPPSIRALMGEVKDPLANIFETAQRLTALATSQSYFLQEYKENYGKLIFDKGKAPVNGNFVAPIPDKPEFGALRGKMTTPRHLETLEIAAKAGDLNLALLGDVAPQDMISYLMYKMSTTWVAGIGAAAKALSVFTTPAGYVMNLVGAHFALLSNANFNPKAWAAGAKLAREIIANKDRTDPSELMLEIFKAGGMDSALVGEFQKDIRKGVYDSILQELDPAGFTAFKKWDSVKGAVEHAKDRVVDVYSMMDLWVKFANYVNDKQEVKAFYDRQGIKYTEAQLIKDVAVRIQKSNLTQKKAPALVRATERVGITTFGLYFAETYRSLIGSMMLGFNDIKTGNKYNDSKMRNYGRARVAGSIAAMGIYQTALYSTIKYVVDTFLMDNDEEEDEKIRAAMEALGDYAKGKVLLPIGKDADGNYEFFELSRMDPGDPLAAPLRLMARGDFEGAAQSFMSLQFLNPGLQGLINATFRPDKQSLIEGQAPQMYQWLGELLTEMDMSQEVQNRVILASERLVAPSVVRNVANLLTDPKEQDAATNTMRLMGMSPITFNVKEASRITGAMYGSAMGELRDNVRGLSQFITADSKDKLEDAYIESLEKEQEAFKKLVTYVRGAEASGVRPTQYSQYLKDQRVSEEVIKNARRGVFKSQMLTDTFLDGVEKDLARRVGPAQAKIRVRQVKAQLEQLQRKYRNFNGEEN